VLSAETIEKQKTSLLEEKERLNKKIEQLKQFPDYGKSEDDNARELADFQSNISIEEQLKHLVSKIDAALVAIENGSYGSCKKCENAIEDGRLELMPYADLCVKCSKGGKGKK
jgi:RNA polymerase-binding protein DksA